MDENGKSFFLMQAGLEKTAARNPSSRLFMSEKPV
jgi:hypothetical protein